MAERYNFLKDDPVFIISERERTRQKYHRLKYRDKYKLNKEQKRTVMQRYYENNPEKRAATYMVSNAIRDSRLTKHPCQICGTIERVQAHHEDYNKPLEVTWLCVKHHNERHIQLREERLMTNNFSVSWRNLIPGKV